MVMSSILFQAGSEVLISKKNKFLGKKNAYLGKLIFLLPEILL